MQKVAIVILNYNGQKYLEEFLPIVIDNSKGCRIIVADNLSTDNSLSYLQSHFPQIDIIRIPENRGYSAGYNYALNLIDAKYYILLNSDVEVTPNWTFPIVEFMDAHEEVAACQPKILSYHNKGKFEYAGAAGGFIDKLGYPFCRGRIFSSIESDHGQYNDRIEIFWATGACLFIRSIDFHKSGGFDEDFFAHMEEIDLCWRLQLSRRKIYYIGDSTVYHVGGGTLSTSNPQKTYLNFRNGLTMLFKNTASSHLFSRIFIRLILDGIAAFKFLFDSGIHHFIAVIKAHLHFYLRILILKRKRAAINHSNSTPMVYDQSVVFQYYIKGNKEYDKLPFSK